MLNLLHARTFLTVLDQRGLRAASRSLKLAPSTVLDHIARLEHELAARLIVRQNGIMVPTPQGEVFRPLAAALISTAEKARHLVANAPLRLAAASNIGVYLLQPTLSSFRSDDPVDIDLWFGSNPEVQERLTRGEADLAIVEYWQDAAGFEAHPWRRARLALIVAPQHPWARRKRVNPRDLLGQRILGGEKATGTGKLLRDQLGPIVEKLQLVDGLGSTEAVKRAVRANFGISLVMAESVRDEVEAGTLVALQLAGVEMVKQTMMVVPRGMPVSTPAVRFLSRALEGEHGARHCAGPTGTTHRNA